MDRAIYDAMAAQDSVHWWYVARRDVLHDLIARRVAPRKNARILEIGCGTGHNLAMLARFGAVEGHELDPASRQLAANRFGPVIGEARLPELEGVPEASYDLVALLDVLEHVEDDVSALKSIAGKLAKDGRLLITVPQHPWMWSGHDVANHHFRRYTMRGLRQTIQAAGLRIELVSSFNSLLYPLAAVSRVSARIRKREGSDDALPPAPVNGIFRRVFGLERYLIGRVPMPSGVSLVAIASAR